jgi:hypothetical protein
MSCARRVHGLRYAARVLVHVYTHTHTHTEHHYPYNMLAKQRNHKNTRDNHYIHMYIYIHTRSQHHDPYNMLAQQRNHTEHTAKKHQIPHMLAPHPSVRDHPPPQEHTPAHVPEQSVHGMCQSTPQQHGVLPRVHHGRLDFTVLSQHRQNEPVVNKHGTLRSTAPVVQRASASPSGPTDGHLLYFDQLKSPPHRHCMRGR